MPKVIDAFHLRDATIAVIRGMTWPALRPYAISLSQSGFKGEKVIFVESVTQDVVENLQRLGFLVIPRTPMAPSQSDIQTMQADWVYGKYRIDPVIAFLEHNPARYVIWTDVRDVVFQSNPSDWLEKNLGGYKLVVAGLGRTLQSCPYNGLWARVASGSAVAVSGSNNSAFAYQLTGEDDLWEQIKDQEGVAFSTCAGEYREMLDLLRDLQGGCAAIPGTTDQGIFNCLIRTDPYKEITWVPPLSAGFSAQWWLGRPEAEIDLPEYGFPVFNTDDHIVYTPDGKTPMAIVHMYDRSAEWTGAINEKFSKDREEREDQGEI